MAKFLQPKSCRSLIIAATLSGTICSKPDSPHWILPRISREKMCILSALYCSRAKPKDVSQRLTNFIGLSTWRLKISCKETVARLKWRYFPIRRGRTHVLKKAFEFDLKLQGKKIAGAAIRRNRKGSLLQGSIQRLKSTGIFEVHPQIDPVLMKDSSDLRGNDSTESLIAPGDISSRPFGSLHRADLARLIFDRLV
jgi:hypothetical protein